MAAQSAKGTGLKFHFTYEPGVTQKQMVAFEMAGKAWSHYLKDDMTVNIHVAMSDELPSNVIGGALPGFSTVGVPDLQREMKQDVISPEDKTAHDRLENNIFRGYVSHRMGIKTGSEGYAHQRGYAHRTYNLTTADTKSLGLMDSSTSDLDGYIMMNQLANGSIQWHYETGQGRIAADKVDFLSVAIHEIGHVLGFVSGIDANSENWVDLIERQTLIDQTGGESVYDSELSNLLWDRVSHTTLLDLFRHEKDSISFWSDIALGGSPVFSIDSNKTQILPFANGREVTGDSLLGLDNFQGSHWSADSNAGVMVPGIFPGQRNAITDTELIAFDVIGYDRNGAFTPLNYGNLYQQSIATVNQYDSSRNNQSRLDDVLTMVESSTMYEGRGSRTRSSIRQELLDIFAQEALFSSFDMENWQTYLESITLNESGTDGEDILQGGIGDDRIRGLQNADILKGYEGDDLLKGNQGGDRILGGEGNDTLIGGNGNDILKGEAGDDLLKGGAGIDVMVGGDGADTFVIDNAAGFNVIRDFAVGEDQLLIAEGLQVNLGQRNAHTTITLADDEKNLIAVIRNVDMADISL